MVSLVVALVGTTYSTADTTPVELGAIPWLRDYDEALALARKTKKPLLVLFQEVPG